MMTFINLFRDASAHDHAMGALNMALVAIAGGLTWFIIHRVERNREGSDK